MYNFSVRIFTIFYLSPDLVRVKLNWLAIYYFFCKANIFFIFFIFWGLRRFAPPLRFGFAVAHTFTPCGRFGTAAQARQPSASLARPVGLHFSFFIFHSRPKGAEREG
jgi:hypothetical protein